MYGLHAIGGLSPVSMSISTNSILPMSPLPFEIILSYLSHRLQNFSLVSTLITLFSRSTFLCVSTSAGDLIKFVAEVNILCKSISVLILVPLNLCFLWRSG